MVLETNSAEPTHFSPIFTKVMILRFNFFILSYLSIRLFMRNTQKPLNIYAYTFVEAFLSFFFLLSYLFVQVFIRQAYMYMHVSIYFYWQSIRGSDLDLFSSRSSLYRGESWSSCELLQRKEDILVFHQILVDGRSLDETL